MNFRIIILQVYIVFFSFISAAPSLALNRFPPILPKAANDTTRVSQLYALADSLLPTSPQQALTIGKQAMVVAELLKFEKGIAKAAILVGNAFQKQGVNDSALFYFQKSLKSSKAINDKIGIGKCLNNIGIVYDFQGDYEKALGYYFQALITWREVAYNKGVSTSLHNIGIIYNTQKEYDKAVDYLQQSLALWEEMNDAEGMSYSLNNLGLVYFSKQDYEKALSYYLLSIEKSEAMEDKGLFASALHGIGEVYLEQKKYDQALSYMSRSLDIFREIGDVYGEMQALIGMSERYKATEKLDKSLYYSKKALDLARKTGSKPEVKSASKILSSIYQLQNNFQKAFEYQSLYLAYNDSIFNLEKQKVSNALELARKDAENEILKKENELKMAQIERGEAVIQQQSILVAAISVGLLLAGIVAFVLYNANRQKQKSNQQLQQQKAEIIEINNALGNLNGELKLQHKTMREQNRELERLNGIKDKLFSIISHDFRSPLSSLQGVINLLNENALSAQEIKTVFVGLSDKVRNTTGMLDNLLNWTRTQMQGIKANPSEIDLNALAEENVSLVKLSAYKKGITLENEITEPVKAYADAEMIKLVFRNLISNAIKFSAIGDKVSLSAISDGDYVTVSVKDTGMGITVENQENLFQAGDYTTFGTANEKGTGLGLALCKDFIESNHGKLWVKSKEKEGSTFSFTLPVHAAVLHSSPQKKAALS